MVGVILYKNFETGSYENMTVTCFDGESYADIERQKEFTSYIVSESGFCIRKTASTSDAAPEPKAGDIREICEKAWEFFCNNSHCTVAEFVKAETEISFRYRSGKCGVYAPVDIRNIRCAPSENIYALCPNTKDKAPLYLSLLCDMLNFCMNMLFDAEEQVYDFSGNGVYINTSVFLKKFPSVVGFAGRNSRRRHHKINLAKMCKKDICIESGTSSLTGHRIITRYRFLRKNALDIVCKTLGRVRRASDVQKILLTLPDCRDIHDLAEDFVQELTEALGVYTYVFDAKSHIYYIGIKEALRLITCGEETNDTLAQRAFALSANMKLRSRLPNPDYYTSCGKAVWK